MGHILVKNLSKEFVNRRHGGREKGTSAFGATIPVLENIEAEVQDGEMVCFLGPSGCGKSTLLRIIAGFDTQTSGTLTIDGKPVDGASSDNIFVFQHSGLLPWMTVWQNVELGLRQMDNLESKENEIRDYIEMVELDGFEDHYPYQLSGGMQRRAELARALAVNPDMLIMDEPFGALDPGTREDLQLTIIETFEQQHTTIFFVTHDLEEAIFVGGRLLVLSTFYTPEGGDDAVGAKLVMDVATPGCATTGDKKKGEFQDFIENVRLQGFNPEHRQHVEDFDRRQDSG